MESYNIIRRITEGKAKRLRESVKRDRDSWAQEGLRLVIHTTSKLMVFTDTYHLHNSTIVVTNDRTIIKSKDVQDRAVVYGILCPDEIRPESVESRFKQIVSRI